MHHGVVMFPTEYAIPPDELARALEERGFESVWFPEHTHIPASRRSPFPAGGDLPKEYWSAYDPFIALMAAAGTTRRLKLGTGICLVVEHDPITTAKQVATLDRLSGGRVLFGIGGGWNAEEMEDHSTAFKSRWRLLREPRELGREDRADARCRRPGLPGGRDVARAAAGAPRGPRSAVGERSGGAGALVPICIAPALRAGAPAAAERRPPRARAEDSLARRHAGAGVRAAGVSGALGGDDAPARNQPAHLPRPAGPACPLARASGRLRTRAARAHGLAAAAGRRSGGHRAEDRQSARQPARGPT